VIPARSARSFTEFTLERSEGLTMTRLFMAFHSEERRHPDRREGSHCGSLRCRRDRSPPFTMTRLFMAFHSEERRHPDRREGSRRRAA
jgi:hypothetical protein